MPLLTASSAKLNEAFIKLVLSKAVNTFRFYHLRTHLLIMPILLAAKALYLLAILIIKHEISIVIVLLNNHFIIVRRTIFL